MTRRAPLVVLLAALTILCQTAPLNSRRELSSSTTTSSSVDVPLPSAATQNATSTPTLTMVPNWAAYTNGTRGYALNQLLSQGISSDAPQRWVTADGIASTQIGGSDPAGSNKDLDAAINTVFGDESNHRTWVDTYIDFLLKAGNSSLAEGATIFKELAGNKTAWAAEQVKLVRAYEAAHPGNISYVGVYIGNVSRVDGLDLGQMEDWARRGGDANCTSSADGKLASSSRTLNEASNSSSGDNCTFDSSGSYTAKDYKKFLAVASQNSDMEKKVAALKITLQMELQGFQLKRISDLGIFNLTMDTGGAGSYTDFVPAWNATFIGWGTQNSTSYQLLESNLNAGPTESTHASSMSGLGTRDEAETGRSSRGLSALQSVAHGINSTTSGDIFAPKPAKLKVLAAAPGPAVAMSAAADVDPLNQPLPDNQQLVLLRLQEGTWADHRADWIRFARENTPHVVDKYFGSGNSGLGPIGRHWTHLVLIMFTDSTGSNEVRAELLGKVYEVVPGL